MENSLKIAEIMFEYDGCLEYFIVREIDVTHVRLIKTGYDYKGQHYEEERNNGAIYHIAQFVKEIEQALWGWLKLGEDINGRVFAI